MNWDFLFGIFCGIAIAIAIKGIIEFGRNNPEPKKEVIK
jgi:hypothetical protein